ncbi:hypothetical protein HBH64_204650 [Parastagonospora nodorum]|nr:hypothetical protein HBH53_200620 [Parastagonospora nodorum]KAH3963967.1 hypothetical protein HBH52_213700 [Parastagonospora nodorum]KAH3992971.1 hypothetical protein HBI10_209150 [Parastagonospora nodorum]KAH4077911.1 hypothetical protein HBH48_235790 [Parastagonospora nodorum]KAH4083998.1 hypothetical protein HBH46_215260 [Parastagonospora nodorum]
MHVCLLQAVFVPAFNLINCPLTFLTPRRRFFVLHMHHRLALHALHTFFPVLVVSLRRDKESKEHGRIHFANLQADCRGSEGAGIESAGGTIVVDDVVEDTDVVEAFVFVYVGTVS